MIGSERPHLLGAGFGVNEFLDLPDLQGSIIVVDDGYDDNCLVERIGSGCSLRLVGEL